MQFKAIFFIAATLIAAGLLGVELNLLARGRAAVRLLEQENRQQETGNDHLAGEIEGLRVSKPRIDALYRSEEHTSELQSPDHLVCRLLLEKKKKQQDIQS